MIRGCRDFANVCTFARCTPFPRAHAAVLLLSPPFSARTFHQSPSDWTGLQGRQPTRSHGQRRRWKDYEPVLYVKYPDFWVKDMVVRPVCMLVTHHCRLMYLKRKCYTDRRKKDISAKSMSHRRSGTTMRSQG